MLNVEMRTQWLPILGRFISRDPLSGAEFSQGSNVYAYVSNNAVNWVDPFGLWQMTIQGGAGIGGQLSIGWNAGHLNIGAKIGAAIGLSIDVDSS